MSHAVRLPAPSTSLLFTEGFRAVGDLARFAGARSTLLKQLPRGDGHPVLVLPGFLTRNSSTFLLRRFLRRLNYRVSGWEQGRNLGLRNGVAEGMAAQLKAMADRSGRKVSLVGQSLGGTFARQLAKAQPELVRLVVTLGSPLALHPKSTNAWRVYEWATGEDIEKVAREVDMSPPRDVPCTAIYSRTDGVVAWRGSMDVKAARRENIEIESSHIGMAIHPGAIATIGYRLSQPEGSWTPFEIEAWNARFFPAVRESRGR